MPHATDTTAEEIIRSLDRAKTDRANWNNHWQQVANFVLPTREFITKRTPGVELRSRIYNATAPQACISLAAAIHGLLMNPSIRWFSLAFQDFDDNLDEESQLWLYDSTSRLLAYYNSTSSNFALSSYETALDLVAFGTAIILLREDNDRLWFQARQLSNFYIIDNDAGDPIDNYREFEMTIRDAVAEFGDRLHPETLKLGDEKQSYEKKITIIHWVYKRDLRDPQRRNGTNKPWGSVYIERGKKHIISRDGFDYQPYLTPRWSKAPEEVYGRSPAMTILPDIRVVNAMSKTQLVAGEQMVRPPVNVPANSVEGTVRTAPGALNYYRAGTRDFAQPMQLGTRPDVGADLIREKEDKIEAAFFLDRFKLPTADSEHGQTRMTATEIIERRQQGLLMTSPILSRLYAEWLNPVVVRTFNWMRKTRRFLPMPPQMENRSLRIVYQSPLALSQRASESQGFLAAWNTSAPLSTADPTVLDNLEGDEAFRSVFAMWNVSPRFLRPKQAVAALRAQRAQDESAARDIELAQGAASAGRDVAAAVKDVSGG